MKNRILRRIIGLMAVLVIVGPTLQAQNQKSLKLSDFNLKIEGTSSLHDWEMEVNEVEGYTQTLFNSPTVAGIEDAEIVVKVKSIKSDKSLMNKKTYNALKADDYSEISFEMQSVNDLKSSGSQFSGKALGDLTIAGKSERVLIPFKGKVNNNGSGITVLGEYSLNMTEYDVEPPKAMMGSIKTGEDVTLEYEFTFK
ncbi:MAG: YceI family protein [Bacteroidales bacterium]